LDDEVLTVSPSPGFCGGKFRQATPTGMSAGVKQGCGRNTSYFLALHVGPTSTYAIGGDISKTLEYTPKYEVACTFNWHQFR